MFVLLGNVAPIEMKRRDTSHLTTDEAVFDAGRKMFPDRDVDSYDANTVRDLIAENRAPVELDSVGGQSITQISIPDGTKVSQALALVIQGWSSQSTEPPAWAEADDPALTAILAAEFGCDTKAPADWMHDKKGNAPWRAFPGLTALATLASVFMLVALVLATRMQLRTNAGRDFQSNVMGGGALANAGTLAMRPADYLALTTNAAAPALGDTTLNSELSGGGLGRTQAAYAHTASSTSYTLIYEWTSADGTARTINKMGVFNAASVGIMVFSSLVPSPPTLVAGDRLQITSTIDIT